MSGPAPVHVLWRGQTHPHLLSTKSRRLSVREGLLTGATIQPSPSTIQPSPSTTQPIQSVRVTWKGSQLLLPVLSDSGADASFMCPTLVHCLGIPTMSLNDPVHPCALTGTPLDEVRLVTAPVKLLMSGNHHEELAFLVMRSPRTTLVLGQP